MLETGAGIVDRYLQLKTERGNFENVWQDIADDVLGLRHFNQQYSFGLQRHKTIYDTTAMSAGMLLASTMNGLLTNPGAPWHQAVVPAGAREIGLNNDYLVHIDEVLDKLYKDPKFGFPTAATEWYIDYVFFGTSGMFTDSVRGLGPMDHARPLGELVLDEGFDGRVDTVYRTYMPTLRQFVQEFGRNADETITKRAETEGNRTITMIHLVHPRADIVSGPLTRPNTRFRSAHVIQESGKVVRESGYHSDPWQVARWNKDAGEKYGRGPGWQALPDSQTASEMARIVLETGQKDLDPALLVPDDGILTQIDTSPRALVVYRAGAFDKDGIRQFPHGQATATSQEAIQNTRTQIQERFYAHLLQLFDGAVPTATQALEMETKSARILVSVISRAAAEFASKSLARKFDIAQRANMFDDAPDTMAGIPIGINYLSPIMKAQRQMQTRATLNVYAAAQQMAQASGDMSVFDNFRKDRQIRQIAEAEGMDLSGLEAVEMVAQVRQIRAQAEQTQQQLEQLTQGASAVSKALPALAQAQQDRGAPVAEAA
jgi:hypothetical protein